jgi:hypothetical protein
LSVAVGDILRVENTTGTDSETGADDYFELARVVAVSGSTVTLGTRLAYAHANPIVSVVQMVKNASINGGEITTLAAQYVNGLRVHNLRTSRLSHLYVYDFHEQDITARGDLTSPIVANWTFCREGTVSNVVTSGARGTTDNGSFKMMSPIDVTVDGITSGDTMRTSGSAGIYPFFVDYFFTPYVGWAQRCTFNNITTRKPNVGAAHGAWVIGARDCTVSGFTSDGNFRLQRCGAMNLSAITCDGLLLQTSAGPWVVAGVDATYASLEGAVDVTLGPGTVGGTAGVSSDRAVWVRSDGTTNSARVNLLGLISRSTDGAETFIYLQSCDGVLISGCADRTGLLSSVTVGSSTTDLRYGVNRFANTTNVNPTHNFQGAIAHTGTKIGFYSATPATKPTVSGSRGGNAALADLLTELATLGLITDSSSA